MRERMGKKRRKLFRGYVKQARRRLERCVVKTAGGNSATGQFEVVIAKVERLLEICQTREKSNGAEDGEAFKETDGEVDRTSMMIEWRSEVGEYRRWCDNVFNRLQSALGSEAATDFTFPLAAEKVYYRGGSQQRILHSRAEKVES